MCGYRSRLYAGPEQEGDRVDAAAFAEGQQLGIAAATELAMRSRGARRRPAFGPSSLTPTERAVADLVAAGRTNREIAAQLLISTATVKTHLTRVLAKLGISNRTQLALLAAPAPGEAVEP